MLKMTNLQIAKAFEALDNIGKINIEFSDHLFVHDLALNKKALEPHYEAIKLIDSPNNEYKEYQRKLKTAKNELGNDHQALRSKVLELNLKFSKAIEKEAERIDSLPESRKKEIDVNNVKLLKRYTSNGDPVINGSSSTVAQFLMDIEPLFADTQPVSVRPETKQKK